MKLDHFVVHIDNDEEALAKLKREIEPLGFPFEPKHGKGTGGFKAANIWIGRQYFEIIRLLNKSGGGWTPQWVKRYNDGVRGIYCVFLVTHSIDDIARRLKASGISVGAPERITFKAFFGLIKKTLPWQLIYLPPIPGTNLEIGFIQYDPDPNDYIKQFLVPNSDENGITGIESGTIQLPLNSDILNFLKKIFPGGLEQEASFSVSLESGKLLFVHGLGEVQVELHAKTDDPTLRGNNFRFLNVSVVT